MKIQKKMVHVEHSYAKIDLKILSEIGKNVPGTSTDITVMHVHPKLDEVIVVNNRVEGNLDQKIAEIMANIEPINNIVPPIEDNINNLFEDAFDFIMESLPNDPLNLIQNIDNEINDENRLDNDDQNIERNVINNDVILAPPNSPIDDLMAIDFDAMINQNFSNDEINDDLANGIYGMKYPPSFDDYLNDDSEDI